MNQGDAKPVSCRVCEWFIAEGEKPEWDEVEGTGVAYAYCHITDGVLSNPMGPCVADGFWEQTRPEESCR